MFCQRLTNGLRSGLFLSLWGYWIFFKYHFSVTLVECLGLVLCWKVNLRPSLKCLAVWNRISSRILLNLSTSFLPSTLSSFLIFANVKFYHNMLLAPLCFIVWVVFTGWILIHGTVANLKWYYRLNRHGGRLGWHCFDLILNDCKAWTSFGSFSGEGHWANQC